jgi:periplasmic protein CpxP/Spy
MKKLLMIAAIFTIVSFSADAQQQRKRGQERVSPEKRAEMRADRLSEQLDLTEEQKTKIYEIHLERAKAQQELGETRREQMKEQRESRQDVRKEQQAEVENILTPEQKQKWQELRNEDRERMERYRDARGNEQADGLKNHRKSDNLKKDQKIRRNRSNNM